MIVKFEGVDSWNRPIFKSIKSLSRYGSTNKLFDYSADNKQIKENISANDLVFFGNSFDCEPLGDEPIEKIEIDWTE